MTNNTQHRIQITLKHYDHNQSLVCTHNPQHPNNHTKPHRLSHSSRILNHIDHNQALVFCGLSPHNNI